MTVALQHCLEALHACALQGSRRRLFVQSKAVEIICQAIEALGRGGCLAAGETTMLTAAGVRRARHLLARRFTFRPSLEDLAREVGLSRSPLCAALRRILGQSVFDYSQSLCMEQALVLLDRSEASITEIACAVGCKNVSSCSARCSAISASRPRNSDIVASRRRQITVSAQSAGLG